MTHSTLPFLELKQHLQRTIVGQHRLLERLLISVLTEGHLLVEGLPGLAKTTAVRTLAAGMALRFQRIQFTPDMIPGDITGTDILVPAEGRFRFVEGPIFHEIILADEINRAPPKVQSAQVSVSVDGTLNVTNATSNALSAPAVSLANDGTVTFAGYQTLATLTGSTGVVNMAGTLTVLGGSYGGAIVGAGALRVDGEVTLSGSNSTYTGGLTVVGGTLKAGAGHSLPTATSLTIDGMGAFHLGGFDQQVATLASTSSTSTVHNSEATARTLTVSPSSATVPTYAG